MLKHMSSVILWEISTEKMETEILQKSHIICIPCPAQGHINPMLKLAKLLHSKGFYITFVHTEFNYQRLVNSRGLDSVKGLVDFRFETIPDGLPLTNSRGILDLPSLALSMPKNAVVPFHNLITKLINDSPDVPPVTCIISDGVMSFTLEVAKELDIPEMVFFTPSACGFLGYIYYGELVERGYLPLKDEDCLTNGYLDTSIDWIPGMRGIRLRDLPTFLRTTDRYDAMFNYNMEQVQNAYKAKGLILNTFDELEQEVLDVIKSNFPQVYTIGPLSMLCNKISSNQELNSIESNLWKEDTECLEWLDKREAKSVVYVNFGSFAIMTPMQLSEFAWGLANSKYPFLWVIRTDLVNGGSGILSEDFMEETRGRGLISGWCPQEKVISHSSIGGFLTHCGWNSTLESLCEGIPMICWPFFAEQQTNCLYIRSVWGIGMEIDNDVKREEVEILVRELMEGEKGRELRKNVMKWKRKAEESVSHGGSSQVNLERLIKVLKQPE